jgi:hypothetical protein
MALGTLGVKSKPPPGPLLKGNYTYSAEVKETRLSAGVQTPLGSTGSSFFSSQRKNVHSVTGTGSQRKSKKNNHIIGYF